MDGRRPRPLRPQRGRTIEHQGVLEDSGAAAHLGKGKARRRKAAVADVGDFVRAQIVGTVIFG